MRFGITGGAGFIGSNLARLLIGKGYPVVILDDFSTGLETNLKGLDAEVIHGTLSDFDTVQNFTKMVDHVFHLGARGSVPRSIKNPKATFDVNTLGTFNVLEAARYSNLTVTFSSSSSVYGDNHLLPKVETHRLSPITPYAASKAAAENFAYAYSKSYGMKISIVRFFNVFGPYQRHDHAYAAVIPKWIWAAINGDPLILYGDGETTRDFTYVDTVTEALYGIASNRFERDLPINLAFGKPVSLNYIIGELQRFFPEIRVQYMDKREGDLPASENDPTVLKSVLPDLKEIDFCEGLSRTVDWLRDSTKSKH